MAAGLDVVVWWSAFRHTMSEVLCRHKCWQAESESNGPEAEGRGSRQAMAAALGM